MKNEKIRIMLIYILLILIIVLIGAMVFLVLSGNKKSDEPVKKAKSEITDKCTFDLNLKEYSQIIEGKQDEICGGTNKFNINDVILDGNPIDLTVIYNNGIIDASDKKTGIYIGDNRIVRHSSINYLNNIGIFKNMLYVISSSDEDSNIVIYNNLGEKLYDLSSSLKKSIILDNALKEVAKINPEVKATVDSTNIDLSSVTFDEIGFVFKTKVDADCSQFAYNGSTYRVTINENEEFSVPQFLSFNNCENPIMN